MASSTEYDDKDRLTQFTASGVTDTYTYKGLGLRVGKTDSTGSYSYVCDGTSPGSPMLSDGHALYTPGLSERRNGSSLFYNSDNLGNLWSVEDSTGQAEAGAYLFTGFGAPTYTGSGSGSASPLKYGGANGCQTDYDTGLVLMGHRYYDTRIGRFISQDPVGDGDNWYAYADNSPTNEVDPEGLTPSVNIEGWSPMGTPGYADGAESGTAGAFLEYSYSVGHWTNGVGTLLLNNENGSPYIANQYEGHTYWVPDMENMGGTMIASNPAQTHETLWHYLKRQFMSGGNADGHHLGPPPAGLFGGNPNVAKNQVNTNAPGGRAAAKSLFRKLSKGQKVLQGQSRDGSIRRYTEDGSVQIRMKSNGSTNVDIRRSSGNEDVHF